MRSLTKLACLLLTGLLLASGSAGASETVESETRAIARGLGRTSAGSPTGSTAASQGAASERSHEWSTTRGAVSGWPTNSENHSDP